MPPRFAALTALLVIAGCDVIAPGHADDPDAGPADATPLPDEVGVITSPRLGEVAATIGTVTVEGLHTNAREPIEIQVLVAPYDPTTSWTTVATTTTDDEVGGAPGEPSHAFRASFDARAYWPDGGLLSLRARDHAGVLIAFFHDSDDCLAARTTWRVRAMDCGAQLPRGLVLAAQPTLPDAIGLERFLDDKGVSTPADTDAYYVAIDAPATVTDFEARYLRDERAGATYYNVGDLGIGREMRCGSFPTPTGKGTACAVANYGSFGGDPAIGLADAVAGHQSGTSAGAFATVAMVYTPPIDAPNAVRFIAYGPTGALLDRAVLDTHGDNSAIPNNCINCHGSGATYDPIAHVVKNARLLPFDPRALGFAEVDGYRRGDQEDQLRRLNALIYDAAPTAGLAEVIAGFYGGARPSPGARANDAWVPPGWDGPVATHLYREVVAPYCRGCHASRGTSDAGDPIDFTRATSFEASARMISAVVCGPGDGRVHRMPSAEQAQRHFWEGRARAYLAAAIDLRSACAPD